MSSWKDCDLYLGISMDEGSEDTGTVSITYDRSRFLQSHAFMPTCLSGVSRLMYQMYCAGSKLIFDQGVYADDYTTYRGYY